ncbi:TPA: aminomethyl-transferring glycine dehydrogenase subunit GcvPB [Candidatus Bathyarchaeota archaeon]|nr:aminomethyl-transferring glycine dehydrogenase subunit GcvPB [Candidatus Bathyarchaeota archaeon]
MTEPKVRPYHAAAWSEPLIHELGRSGERGVILPEVEADVRKAVGKPELLILKSMRRKAKPGLPELSQPQVLRHWLRLSQMTLGMEAEIDLGVGTCTMKYSPKVNEELAAMVANMHPDQPEESMQGLLEVAWRFANVYLREVSGLDAFTFQPPGGSAGAFNNAAIMRRYHELNGELDQRDEIITTIFSHPCDAACPATAGFKVVTLYPDEETGYPSVEALKAAVSRRTAGIFVTNPEDTGIFNGHIDEWTSIVHEVGGLCAYDQANLNAVMGVTRAADAGFDLCFFNLHKTFSSPHGSSGPGSGAVGVTEELEEYLPVPVIIKEGEEYHLDYDRPKSIGRVRDFLGNLQVVVRAYAWAAAMGADGLREAAEVSMINNQYLSEKMKEVPGVTKPYGGKRLDQVRWSLEKLKKETGCGIDDVNHRVIDYGVQSFFTSHHPWVVPEPFTPEPCETYSKADIDYWIAVLKRVCEEAYEDPKILKEAPHNSSIHALDSAPFDDPERWAMSWRAYRRKMK